MWQFIIKKNYFEVIEKKKKSWYKKTSENRVNIILLWTIYIYKGKLIF